MRKKLEDKDEGQILWDEYKYRHDLIWRHMIRSTVAVIGLVVVPYSTTLKEDKNLSLIASILALAYLVYTSWVLSKELKLFSQVKRLHRIRQWFLFGLHKKKISEDGKVYDEGGFNTRVFVYLGGLLVVILAAIFNIIYISYEVENSAVGEKLFY